MNTISIIFGKIILFLCKLLKRGSAMPGELTYRINKNILSYFKMPKITVAVTGSSGKGSTTKIIAQVLRKEGYTVAYNDKGSNERSAIITTLIENSNIFGKVKADICVFEMDERYAKYVFPYIKPNYVIVTNITKDQPPRQGHIDIVYKELLKAIDTSSTLITNADDPYLQKFNYDKKYNTIYYSIDKNKRSYKKNKFEVLNITRCPLCHEELIYDYYHIEDLGSYKCPSCDFKKPDSKYNITSFKDNEITINNNKITLKNNMLYNLYNTLAAYSFLREIGIKEENITKHLNEINKDKKIYNNYTYNNKNVYVLNNKNENASTFNQSVLYTSNDKNEKTVVIGWWQISRRYDFDDLSWLYDIEFELLNKNTKSFIVAGPQRYDIATRLKYAGIDEKKIKIYKDLYEAKDEIKKSNTNIYAILNFDYIKPFNEIMEEEV